MHIESRARKLKVAEADLKFAPVVALASCATRERDWANVVSAHEGDAVAHTWQLAKYRCAALLVAACIPRMCQQPQHLLHIVAVYSTGSSASCRLLWPNTYRGVASPPQDEQLHSVGCEVQARRPSAACAATAKTRRAAIRCGDCCLPDILWQLCLCWDSVGAHR